MGKSPLHRGLPHRNCPGLDGYHLVGTYLSHNSSAKLVGCPSQSRLRLNLPCKRCRIVFRFSQRKQNSPVCAIGALLRNRSRWKHLVYCIIFNFCEDKFSSICAMVDWSSLVDCEYGVNCGGILCWGAG